MTTYDFKPTALYINQVTGETFSEMDTDEKALSALPQIEAVKNIYLIHRKLGEDIMHAFVKAAQAYIDASKRNAAPTVTP